MTTFTAFLLQSNDERRLKDISVNTWKSKNLHKMSLTVATDTA